MLKIDSHDSIIEFDGNSVDSGGEYRKESKLHVSFIGKRRFLMAGLTFWLLRMTQFIFSCLFWDNSGLKIAQRKVRKS